MTPEEFSKKHGIIFWGTDEIMEACTHWQDSSDKLTIAKEALDSMIAISYSWVIKEDTAYEINPLMDRVRNKAKEALEKLK